MFTENWRPTKTAAFKQINKTKRRKKKKIGLEGWIGMYSVRLILVAPSNWSEKRENLTATDWQWIQFTNLCDLISTCIYAIQCSRGRAHARHTHTHIIEDHLLLLTFEFCDLLVGHFYWSNSVYIQTLFKPFKRLKLYI